MHRHWAALCGALHVAADVEQRWATRIVQFYSEPHRHYHTLTHVADLFHGLQRFTADGSVQLTEREHVCIGLAIVFHDIIYETVGAAAALSEQRSAEAFAEFAEETRLDSALRESVHSFIMATKGHRCAEDAPAAMRLFLDLDLSVLARGEEGASAAFGVILLLVFVCVVVLSSHCYLSSTVPSDASFTAYMCLLCTGYRQYASEIRSEYCHYSEPDYCRGRAAVLKHLLSLSPIYKHPATRAALEAAARVNMERELAELTAQAQSLQ